MTTATYYHAGCPVCVTAETGLATALDPSRYEVETIHLGDQPERLADAKAAGVQSVPALVIDGQVFHINHGADITALG